MNRRRNWRGATAAICAAAFAAGPARAAETWLSPPPDRAAWEAAATAIPPADIFAVSADALPAALVLLSAKAVVPLTPASGVQYIAPAPPPGDTTLMPFLVRAVSREPCTGGFTAERNGNAVWVDFSCIATAATTTSHKALVLYLPASVQSLFVTSAALH